MEKQGKSFVCKQLSNTDHLSDEQYKSISKLIYDTDPFIYPALFGEGLTGLNNATKILPLAFESGMDYMFHKKNLYILLVEEKIVALILWIKGELQWDPNQFIAFANSLEISLKNKNVYAVGERYVDCRYESKRNDDKSISLVNVCVDHSFRGKGLGKLILESFLAEHKNEHIELCVLANNEGAIRLYQKAGFSFICESSGFSLNGESPRCYDMERKPIKTENCFQCLGPDCPNHCCKDYDGFSDRLIPLNKIGFSEIVLIDKDVEELRKIGREDLLASGSNGIHRIKTKENGTCYALQDGKCEIYKARPSICRAYPFYLDFFAGLCALKECPGFPKESTTDIEINMKQAISSLLDVYQFWINTWRKALDK